MRIVSFELTPDKHTTANQGCPGCRTALLRLKWIEQANGREGVLYFLRVFNEREEFYKVGITFRSVEKRFEPKGSLANYNYEVIAKYKSANVGSVYDWEQSIVETFTHLRYKPKLRFDGETECFSSCEEILSCFPI